jgi:hypothetical protein
MKDDYTAGEGACYNGEPEFEHEHSPEWYAGYDRMNAMFEGDREQPDDRQEPGGETLNTLEELRKFAGRLETEEMDQLLLNELVAAAIARGAKGEREKIRNGSKYLDCSDEDDALSFWHVPASILSKTEVKRED